MYSFGIFWYLVMKTVFFKTITWYYNKIESTSPLVQLEELNYYNYLKNLKVSFCFFEIKISSLKEL